MYKMQATFFKPSGYHVPTEVPFLTCLFRLSHFFRCLPRTSFLSLTQCLFLSPRPITQCRRVDRSLYLICFLNLEDSKHPMDVIFKKGTRVRLTKQFVSDTPYTFLKSATALFESSKSPHIHLPALQTDGCPGRNIHQAKKRVLGACGQSAEGRQPDK